MDRQDGRKDGGCLSVSEVIGCGFQRVARGLHMHSGLSDSHGASVTLRWPHVHVCSHFPQNPILPCFAFQAGQTTTPGWKEGQLSESQSAQLCGSGITRHLSCWAILLLHCHLLWGWGRLSSNSASFCKVVLLRGPTSQSRAPLLSGSHHSLGNRRVSSQVIASLGEMTFLKPEPPRSC